MKLTPHVWNWQLPQPAAGWLEGCPAESPLIWQARISEARNATGHLLSVLSVEERARMERFRIPDDQQRFLVGRGLLRIFLGIHWGVAALDVQLKYGPIGKPFAIFPSTSSKVHFNISHSGDLVLLAFHPAQEVGVDVEKVRPTQDWDAIARRVFLPDEYRRLTRVTPTDQLVAFFRAWTRHEARVKALGLGVSGETPAAADCSAVCFDLVLPEGYQGAAACRYP